MRIMGVVGVSHYRACFEEPQGLICGEPQPQPWATHPPQLPGPNNILPTPCSIAKPGSGPVTCFLLENSLPSRCKEMGLRDVCCYFADHHEQVLLLVTSCPARRDNNWPAQAISSPRPECLLEPHHLAIQIWHRPVSSLATVGLASATVLNLHNLAVPDSQKCSRRGKEPRSSPPAGCLSSRARLRTSSWRMLTWRWRWVSGESPMGLQKWVLWRSNN